MRELDIVALLVPVLAPVVLGWLLVQAKVFKTSDAKPLSLSFLYVFLPALLINHLAAQSVRALLDWRFIGITAVLMMLLFLAVLIVRLSVRRNELDSAAMAAFAAAKFNAVVMGLPLLLIALGHEAIVPVLINLILSYFTILPLALMLLEVSVARKSGKEVRPVPVLFRAFRHAVLDPPVSATLLGLLLAGLHMTLPHVVAQSLSVLGDAAVPVPLLALGMTISVKGLRESGREIVWISLVRVIASPVIALAAAIAIRLPAPQAIALVISFSMPTAKLAFALAEEFGVYVQPLASIVTLTTLSMPLIYPAFLLLCNHFWPGVIGRHP
jgi:malonate transporter and related proteins